jgi:hypothetical protein
MAVDIDEGDPVTVQIEGASCFYVLTSASGREMEASVFRNTKEDRKELKEALQSALAAKQIIILLRVATSAGTVGGWQSLEPAAFASRL